jgi:hypothetical protein
MIKKTLCFSNPAYLSLKDAQLVIKLPEIVNAQGLPELVKKQGEITRPVEDVGVVVLDHKQITITSGALEALLENNCAVITCNSRSMPTGLLLPLAETPRKMSGSETKSMPPFHCASNCGNKPFNIKSGIKPRFSPFVLMLKSSVCRYGPTK